MAQTECGYNGFSTQHKHLFFKQRLSWTKATPEKSSTQTLALLPAATGATRWRSELQRLWVRQMLLALPGMRDSGSKHLPLSTWSPPGRKLLITHHPPCSVEVRVFLLSPSEHTVRPLKVAVANRLLSLGYHVAGCSSRTVLSWIWDEDPRKLEHSADLPFITCVSNRLSKSKNGSLCLLHQITEACRVTDERQRGDICSV